MDGKRERISSNNLNLQGSDRSHGPVPSIQMSAMEKLPLETTRPETAFLKSSTSSGPNPSEQTTYLHLFDPLTPIRVIAGYAETSDSKTSTSCIRHISSIPYDSEMNPLNLPPYLFCIQRSAQMKHNFPFGDILRNPFSMKPTNKSVPMVTVFNISMYVRRRFTGTSSDLTYGGFPMTTSYPPSDSKSESPVLIQDVVKDCASSYEKPLKSRIFETSSLHIATLDSSMSTAWMQSFNESAVCLDDFKELHNLRTIGTTNAPRPHAGSKILRRDRSRSLV